MSEYKLILKFDDGIHSLSKEKGITILNLSEILKDLYHALDLDSNINFTLTEIKSSSYAVLFSCTSKIYVDRFKKLNENINQEPNLPAKEKKYAESISNILKSGVFVTAQVENENWSVELNEIKAEIGPNYYYEVEEIVGIVTKIGSDDLDSKSIIRLDKFHFNITISKKQENELRDIFKANKISAVVKIKKSLENSKILDSSLLNFTVIDNKNFKELVEELHSLNDDVFADVIDSVETIRAIRK